MSAFKFLSSFNASSGELMMTAETTRKIQSVSLIQRFTQCKSEVISLDVIVPNTSELTVYDGLKIFAAIGSSRPNRI